VIKLGGAAALVAIAPVLACAAAASAGAAPAAATTPRISLVSQDASTPLGGELHMQLRVDNVDPGSGFTVNVVAHQALRDRTAFDRTLAGGSLGSVQSLVSVPLDGLAPDAADNRSLVLGLQSPTGQRAPERLNARRAGVYPLEVDLQDAASESRSRFVTYLVVVAPAGVSGAVSHPLGVAWVWPLAAAPGSADARYVAQLRPDGRLGKQAAALASATDIPLTIVPSPETLQTWDALARQDPLLSDGRDAIRRALSTDQVIAGPYVPIDLPSLLRAGMNAAVDTEFIEGADTLTKFFNRARVDARTALGVPVDSAALTRLRAGGVDRVVVEGGAVQASRSSRGTLSQPFTLSSAGFGGPGEPVAALASDTDLARLLTGTDPAALRAQRLLAGLALVAFEQPDQARAVAIVNPGDYDPPTALLDAVLGGLRANPLLRPMTVDQVFAQIPAATGGDAVRALAIYDAPSPPISAGAFATAQARLAAFGRLAPTAPNLTDANRALLASISSAWNAPGQATQARADLNIVNGVVDGFLARIHVPTRSTITLTSRSGDIPLTFRNDTGQPVNVLVQLNSPKLSFPDGSQRIVTLPPQNTTVRFAVEARTSGTFPLRLTLSSADGALPIAQAGLKINANAVSTVGLVLIISAAGFLVLWWVFHIRRERRRKLVGVESE
jgi:hypothetical protein